MKLLNKYEKLIAEITKDFLENYYSDYSDDAFWIGDEIGGVLAVGDAFITVDMMIDALRYKPAVSQFHDWYWSYDDEHERAYNLKNFIKLKQ